MQEKFDVFGPIFSAFSATPSHHAYLPAASKPNRGFFHKREKHKSRHEPDDSCLLSFGCAWVCRPAKSG